MSELNLQSEFEKLNPWTTKFTVNGKEYGGNYDPSNDKRLDWFFQSFPKVETILELGSLEGGHSVALARRPGIKRVLGVEGRDANVKRARFVRRFLGCNQLEFIQANLEETDLSSFGEFDAVFCVGLLYHLPKPWEMLEQISRVTKNLFLWTHYASRSEKTIQVHSYRGIMYREFGIRDPLSGLSPESFWPTQDSLYAMLHQYLFENIHVIEDDPTHIHGPAITLAASMQDDFQFPRIASRKSMPSNIEQPTQFSKRLKSAISRILYHAR